MLLCNLTAFRRRRSTVAPPPPPPESGVVFKSRVLDLSRMVIFRAWLEAATRYQRDLKLTVLTGASAVIQFRGLNITNGGTLRPLGDVPVGANAAEQTALRHGVISTTYSLLVDGVASATCPVTQPAKTADSNPAYITDATFTLDLTQIDEGYHELEIAGSPGESNPPFYFYVKKGTGQVPAQTMVPFAADSYDVSHGSDYHWGLVPSDRVPSAHPLPARETPAFSTNVSRTLLNREMLAPVSNNNVVRRFCTTSDGILTTFGPQSYHFYHMVKKYPVIPLLDGPRNVGTASMLTHISVDRHGGAYACDPWRILRISKEGFVTTRCGYKHPKPSSYWLEEPGNWELIGDWSAVPVERRGFHELWGLAFDGDSVSAANLATADPQQTNPTTGELEHPHSTGPRLFVPDSQNNRVCLLTFQRDSFTAPPVVTEFLTGLADPWDNVWRAGVLYVAERLSNRIVAYNAVTGALIRVVAQGASGLATVDNEREALRLAPLATIQAEACVLPEGMFEQDDWLYFGSMSMGQVRRVYLGQTFTLNGALTSANTTSATITGAIPALKIDPYPMRQGWLYITRASGARTIHPFTAEPSGQTFTFSSPQDFSSDGALDGATVEIHQLACTPAVDFNSAFMKIAVSDGTFGPRGTCFTSTWSIANFGMPDAYLPDGTRWSYSTSTLSSAVGRGKGGVWQTIGYASAVGVGHGRLYTGSSAEGVVQISLALPSDTAPAATTYNTGKNQWKQRGHYLLHGEHGFGPFGLPLPWGETPEIDYYLTWNGLTPP